MISLQTQNSYRKAFLISNWDILSFYNHSFSVVLVEWRLFFTFDGIEIV